MVSFDLIPLGFAVTMAFIDVITLSIVKVISLDGARLIKWMVLPTVLYAIQPWIFLNALQISSLVVMNLLWDVLSDILVTLMGVFYFGEKIGSYKQIGIVLSLISIVLLSSKDGDGL